MTAAWLGLLAVILAWPVPALLTRIHSLLLVPRAAVVLWQSVAAGAVLAGFGAALATVQALVTALLRPDGDSDRLTWLGDIDRAEGLQLILAIMLLTATIVALVHLNAAGIRVALRLRKRRRRLRDLVDLLDRSSPDSTAAENVRVLAGSAGPYAYCVPGRHSRVVVSDTALQDLTAEQLAAVIDHEQAHLRARHDLLLEFFTVLHEAFPRGVRSRTPLEETRVLVELLADDAARRRHGARPLVAALATLGNRPPLDGTHGIDADGTEATVPQATAIHATCAGGPVGAYHAGADNGDCADNRDDGLVAPSQTSLIQRQAAEGHAQEMDLDGAGAGIVARLRRLISDPAFADSAGSGPDTGSTGRWSTGSSHATLAVAVYSCAVALIAVPTAVVVLPWLSTTWRLLAGSG
jgi:hypothetical protein